MSENYIIRHGSRIRLLPEIGVDSSLKALVDAAFAKHDCLKAYSIFSMQQGWIFRKKSRVLCFVYEDTNAYQLANAEIGRSLEVYFQLHPGVMDLMSLDAGKEEQRVFASDLISKLPFTKREPIKIITVQRASRVAD